ncbi:DUF3263 domain-containing protein [Microbacteriaceae bacterium VKM Ac-2855]|nr:DUF3263 domain-containing protein [Microbacteriaceae bacterium VKM Ac-2855]
MLDRAHRAILVFEDSHSVHDAAKVAEIREMFALDPVQYYALLGRILSERNAMGSDRRLVDRVRERIATSLDGRVRAAGGR